MEYHSWLPFPFVSAFNQLLPVEWIVYLNTFKLKIIVILSSEKLVPEKWKS